jgi:heterotetrameric sarcosine oxidase gamma subunit
VPDLALAPAPFLGGYDATFGATRLTEITGLGLVSIAVPSGGRTALDAAARAAWDTSLPAIGEGARAGEAVLLGLATDLVLRLAPMPPSGLAVTEVAEALGPAACLTEQTDAWVILRLAGPAALPALARLCPLDLDALPPGRVARTLMEHLGAILFREADESFLLLSASSSAASFRDAVAAALVTVSATGGRP